tara:strand:- start:348 stop:557 length:210 start_codon:yes stop_codon:yes gene_type:complete
LTCNLCKRFLRTWHNVNSVDKREEGTLQGARLEKYRDRRGNMQMNIKIDFHIVTSKSRNIVEELGTGGL